MFFRQVLGRPIRYAPGSEARVREILGSSVPEWEQGERGDHRATAEEERREQNRGKRREGKGSEGEWGITESGEEKRERAE